MKKTSDEILEDMKATQAEIKRLCGKIRADDKLTKDCGIQDMRDWWRETSKNATHKNAPEGQEEA